MPQHLTDLDAAVDWLLARVDGPLRIAAPLALGKPHRLLNQLYARIENDAARPLQLYTALSLMRPRGKAGLEARFLAPFVERHFGADYVDPQYALDQAAAEFEEIIRHGQGRAMAGTEDFWPEFFGEQ